MEGLEMGVVCTCALIWKVMETHGSLGTSGRIELVPWLVPFPLEPLPRKVDSEDYLEMKDETSDLEEA